jgi:hypothetical protein
MKVLWDFGSRISLCLPDVLHKTLEKAAALHLFL